MGAGVSKAQIGEKVRNSKKKIAETEKLVDAQYERLCKNSPETLNDMVQSIEMALTSCSPFPSTTLLLAFKADSERVKKALTDCTRKVMTAPIQKKQYQWFMQYVFTSTVWFNQMENGEHLYSEMMKIVNLKQEQITENMDAVYNHLKSHSKWSAIMNIENKTVISRQDDEAVGLLQEAGIRDILELKDSDDETEDIDGLKNFIDNNLAVNNLMTTAKELDSEFQKEMSTILNRHGEFKPGPMKKVERALSKMENDYMNEEYPTAAKLLDIVRCSVSYNTVGQLLNGYNAFIDHIESGVSSLTLARIKNGFLDEDDGGYRDIKVNVVYQSTVTPNVKMICEVQFILNQYLYEKKRVHKLYSVAREQTYFDMVALEEDELNQRLKAMKFEPILNARDDVTLDHSGQSFYQCTIDSGSGLLSMVGGSNSAHPDHISCVDMVSKQSIFQHSSAGRYSNHWIMINDQKYLSFQTTPNTINMFRVSDDHQFEEDESMKITLDDDDKINFCEYDQSFDHIYIVRNFSILEKRAVNDIGTVSMSIALENRIGNSVSKLLTLSNDGKYCVIGAAGNTAYGGAGSNFFYLVSLQTQEQFKLQTKNLYNTYAPCFINRQSEFVAVGGYKGEGVEIWSVEDKEMVHHIQCPDDSFVTCSYSANDILAVGYAKTYGGGILRIYDISSWTVIFTHETTMVLRYLHLTSDCKYLEAGGSDEGGNGGEKCVVWQIQ